MFSIATPMPGTELWEELLHKNPDTVYNTDFTKSYYYNSYTSEIAPFMNVSDVSDDRAEQDGDQGAQALPGQQGKAQVRAHVRPGLGRADLQGGPGRADPHASAGRC